jgi:hypothetical protein
MGAVIEQFRNAGCPLEFLRYGIDPKVCDPRQVSIIVCLETTMLITDFRKKVDEIRKNCKGWGKMDVKPTITTTLVNTESADVATEFNRNNKGKKRKFVFTDMGAMCADARINVSVVNGRLDLGDGSTPISPTSGDGCTSTLVENESNDTESDEEKEDGDGGSMQTSVITGKVITPGYGPTSKPPTSAATLPTPVITAHYITPKPPTSAATPPTPVITAHFITPKDGHTSTLPEDDGVEIDSEDDEDRAQKLANAEVLRKLANAEVLQKSASKERKRKAREDKDAADQAAAAAAKAKEE